MSPSWPRRLPAILRRVLRSAGATALIVLTLALALGANSAVFTVADALLLRAVPFPAPDRLVAVTIAFPTIKLAGMNLSGPEALELQQLTHVFAASGPYAFSGLVVQGATAAELANAIEVSEGAMRAFAVAPAIGRPLAAGDYLTGGSKVALLGHGLWRRAFGADPSIVGRVVELGGVPREVAGVMPEGITVLNRPVDLWLPRAIDPGNAGSRTDHSFNVVARLAPGRSLAEAVADSSHAMDIWREETGEMHTPHAKMHPIELQSLARATTGLNREPVGALVAAVAFVLLIACANISNLLLARAERRRAEVAIQLALGATRRRLLAESVAEGLALAAAGGLGGLVVSRLIVDLLRTTWPIAASVEMGLDYRTLGWTAALTTLAGALIGIVPVIRLDQTRASDWLKSGDRSSGGAAGRRRLQNGLIAVQIALAVLLSGSAALMVRSLLALTALDSGIAAEGVLRAQVSLPSGSYPDDRQVCAFYDRVLERLRGDPGVTQAAVMSGLPPQRRANNTSFLLDGVEVMDHSSMHQVEFVQHISPGYLETLRIPLREGRDLTPADDERAAPVALVNETLARQFWPNGSAIGRRLKAAGNIGTWLTVVGVVGDVRQNGMQAPAGSEIYVSHRQARLLMSGYMPATMNLLVKSAAAPAVVAATVRRAVTGVDPAAAVSGVAGMQTVIDRTIAQPRLLAWMFGGFAILSLAVAAIGVYAVTSCGVGARASEFGVRMALGARPVDVLRLVMISGVPTILAGVGAGAAAAVVTSRLLRNLLFGVEPLDPASLALSAAAITVAAGAATLLPARRAARVDPLTALRD